MRVWFFSLADYLPWAWIWMAILQWFHPLPVPTTFNTRPWCPSTRETPCMGTTRECQSPAVWPEETPARTTTPPSPPATWGHCPCHSLRTRSKPPPVRSVGTNPQGSTMEWTLVKDARYACTYREDYHLSLVSINYQLSWIRFEPSTFNIEDYKASFWAWLNLLLDGQTL